MSILNLFCPTPSEDVTTDRIASELARLEEDTRLLARQYGEDTERLDALTKRMNELQARQEEKNGKPI